MTMEQSLDAADARVHPCPASVRLVAERRPATGPRPARSPRGIRDVSRGAGPGSRLE
jgi:hypothetical protein